ncbi:MAG: Crp/Fnr family transcriptional regulator, partial [Campylobacterota bacterium]|nr:Crp/Fnr family transcriptional regulator [Campylobacterota bacterium]
MSVQSVIGSISFFSSLNGEQKKYLSTISMVRSFTKNTIIHFESDIDYSLQFLVSGLVKIYKIDKF